MKITSNAILSITALSLGFSSSSFAQTEIKITPNDGAASDEFGRAIAISGDYAAIGAPFNDIPINNGGAVYIYKKNGSQWIQEAKLTANDAENNDQFGISVAIDGDYVVVGAHYDDDNGSITGSAYIFKRTGTNWTQEAKIVPTGVTSNSYLGNSVSIHGDYALIGCRGGNEHGVNSGNAYVYKRNGTNWTQEALLAPNDGSSNDQFATSVAIYDEYAVLGATNIDIGGTNTGATYIFKRTGNTWAQEAKIQSSDLNSNARFGGSVSLFEDYALIGARGFFTGKAYIFKRNGTSWIEEAILTPSDGANEDSFGSVAIQGDYAIVGAYTKDELGVDEGAAYIFKRNGTNWNQTLKLNASDLADTDFFGFAVDIEGNNAIVGAYLDDDNGNNSGSTYMYSDILVGIEKEENQVANGFKLNQNYPNPFNPNTTISYTIPSASKVSLKIYNEAGEFVKELTNSFKAQGAYSVEWNGTNSEGKSVSSGTYFYKLEAGTFSQTNKMILLK